MVVTGRYYDIYGHVWEDVTDCTAAGPIYSLEDVVACGGKVPWIITVHNQVNKPKKKDKKPRNDFIEKKRDNKDWINKRK